MKRKNAVHRAVGWITALCLTNSLLYAPVCNLQTTAVINNVSINVHDAIKNSDESSEFTTVSTEDGFKFEVYSDHAVLAKYSGEDADIVIPATVSGVPVTIIGERVFEYCSLLTSVNIPDSTKIIGKYAFSCCQILTSVNIPDSVTTIGDNAFELTSLISVDIPDSVTSIGNEVFRNCSSLTSVDIPDSITSIGASTFEDCTSLTSVNIPSSVTTIGDSAFYHTNLK
ncbi:MAG: leucine-rich repeat domain-containing protein [Ruminococcus sp.]|nr:leucine-rich repeat domain-containing protein [Ruminococcus sp.]